MESGEYAASIGVYGHENGATMAFAIFALVVATIAWLTNGSGRNPSSIQVISKVPDIQVQDFCKKLAFINFGFLSLFLFGFDALSVWTGAVGKGEFRANLGALGAIPSLMTKFILPALLAYCVSMYCRSERRKKTATLLAMNFMLLFFIGASWGFKSTAFIVLTPALLILYWRPSLFALLGLATIFLIGLVGFSQLFDADVEVYDDVQSYLLRRVTVLQGDVAWYVWDQYVSNEFFPNYWPTLLAAIGDKSLVLIGFSREDLLVWTMHHYDLMITYIAGVSLEQINDGHSITGTPFSEGLIAGGIVGVAFFAVVAGLLVGRTYNFINKSLIRGNDASVAIGSTYFCFYIFAWLNGGAIVQLFHISILIALLVTYLFLIALRGGRVSRVPEASPV